MTSLSGFIITLICISEAYSQRNNYVSSVCSLNEVKLKSLHWMGSSLARMWTKCSSQWYAAFFCNCCLLAIHYYYTIRWQIGLAIILPLLIYAHVCNHFCNSSSALSSENINAMHTNATLMIQQHLLCIALGSRPISAITVSYHCVKCM